MTVYRWRGVNAIGQQKTGRADWPDLAAEGFNSVLFEPVEED